MAKRKVFVSYYGADRDEVQRFLNRWVRDEQVFIPKTVGIDGIGIDAIESQNKDYIMRRIRSEVLGDSTVTMVLVGSCTHSRRYVDWELKASLRRGEGYTSNGVLGIILPSVGRRARLPPRLRDNWNKRNTKCYARYWIAPSNGNQLRSYIEDAYAARVARSHLIVNRADMMKYNRQCMACGTTH